MADNQVKITITADDKTGPQLEAVKKKFNDMREIGEKISNLGTKISAAFTVPIAGIAALVLSNSVLEQSLKPIKDAFSGLITQLAYALYPVVRDLTPAILSIANSISALIAKFAALTVDQKKQILGWVAIVAAIGPVLFAIGQMINFAGTLGVVLTSLSPALIATAMQVWAIVAPVAALAAAVFALITLFQMDELKKGMAILGGKAVESATGSSVAGANTTLRMYNDMGGPGNTDTGAFIRGLVTAPSGGGGSAPVIFNYSPAVSTATKQEAMNTLTPIVQDINRRFVPNR
jgi:hypothetical protein